MPRIPTYEEQMRPAKTLGIPIEQRDISKAISLKQVGKHTPNLPLNTNTPPNTAGEWRAAGNLALTALDILAERNRKRKQELDAAAALNALSAFSDAERQYRMGTDKLKGMDAKDVYDNSKKFVKDTGEKIRSKLENDRQVAMFDQRFYSESQTALDYYARYQQHQDEVAKKNAFAGRVTRAFETVNASPFLPTVKGQLDGLRQELDMANPEGMGGENNVRFNELKRQLYTVALEATRVKLPQKMNIMLKWVQKNEPGLFTPEQLESWKDKSEDAVGNIEVMNVYSELISNPEMRDNPEKAENRINRAFPVRENMSDELKAKRTKWREQTKNMFESEMSAQRARNERRKSDVVKALDNDLAGQLIDGKLTASYIHSKRLMFERAGDVKRMHSWLEALKHQDADTDPVVAGELLLRIDSAEGTEDMQVLDAILENKNLSRSDKEALIKRKYSRLSHDQAKEKATEESKKEKADNLALSSASQLFNKIATAGERNLNKLKVEEEYYKFYRFAQEKDLHGKDILDEAKKWLSEVVKGVYYYQVNEPEEQEIELDEKGQERPVGKLKEVYRKISQKDKQQIRDIFRHRGQYGDDWIPPTPANIARFYINNIDRLYEYDLSPRAYPMPGE